MGPYKYKCSYGLEAVRREDPGLTADELRAANRGGCDAVLLVSILFPEDTHADADFLSLDGRTGLELPTEDLFSAWLAMAKALGKDMRLDEERRTFAQRVFLSAVGHDVVGLAAIAGKRDGAPEA